MKIGHIEEGNIKLTDNIYTSSLWAEMVLAANMDLTQRSYLLLLDSMTLIYDEQPICHFGCLQGHFIHQY